MDYSTRSKPILWHNEREYGWLYVRIKNFLKVQNLFNWASENMQPIITIIING